MQNTETHEGEIIRLTAGARETEVDASGVVRYSDSGRKVRKDKGLRKPHPAGCLHCVMVVDYHLTRDSQIQAAEVACADEDAQIITFRDFLSAYANEQRAMLAAA